MTVTTIVGARPQFVKAAPVSRALAARGIAETLVHTGQHYDPQLSDVFFAELQLPEPDHHLGVGSGTHAAQTGRMLEAIEALLAAERPDWTLVYGDTNSTLAGALEAGLRSFNRAMPEEINRVVADRLSDLLLCPTQAAVRNLAAEGIERGVRLVGDVMYDSVLHNLDLAGQAPSPLDALGVQSHHYYLATVHRAANTDAPARLARLLDLLSSLDAPVLWPLHPRTAKALATAGLEARRGALHPIAPVSYLQMLRLERHARAILTDSGGVQKEAYFLAVPCITLRTETEWVETVEVGWNTLVDTDAARLAAALDALARWDGRRSPFGPGSARPSLYGDGHAAEAIVQALLDTSAG